MKLPVGLAVVNQHYDIQFINSLARRYFSIHGPAVGDDLIHLASGIPSAKLRAAIDAVLREGSAVTLNEFEVEQVASTHPLYLQVVVYPQRSGAEEGPIETALILAHEITALVETQRALGDQTQGLSAELQQVRERLQLDSGARDELIQRLVETNRQLLEANQELTTANEEMRTANEDLLLNTEEAQAATEEVETLNEEMQATNEELETLNEELQSTVEELNTTNDDLHARSVEMQELAQSSEQGRGRLQAILLSMGDAVVLVDTHGAPMIPMSRTSGCSPASTVISFRVTATGSRCPPKVGRRHARRAASPSICRLRSPLRAASSGGSRPTAVRCGSTTAATRAGSSSSATSVSAACNCCRWSSWRVSATSSSAHPPLRVYLQMLLRQVSTLPDSERAREFVQRALGQVEQLTRMVDDLLDVSRTQSGKYTLDLQPLRLDELVTSVVDVGRLLAGGQAIELVVVDAPLVVAGNPGRLEQVLLNLLWENAIRYGGARRTDRRAVAAGGRRGGAAGAPTTARASPPPTSRASSRAFIRAAATRLRAPERDRVATPRVGHGPLPRARDRRRAPRQPGRGLDAGSGTAFTVRLPLANPTPPAEGRGRGSRGRSILCLSAEPGGHHVPVDAMAVAASAGAYDLNRVG